mmetsp:Transcript_38172/g.105216  ORF Transcript_38172/g.105216 Transcript_38172/m.105216 type:complete len:219 (-) Transcript_38172:215-871(-)
MENSSASTTILQLGALHAQCRTTRRCARSRNIPRRIGASSSKTMCQPWCRTCTLQSRRSCALCLRTGMQSFSATMAASSRAPAMAVSAIRRILARRRRKHSRKQRALNWNSRSTRCEATAMPSGAPRSPCSTRTALPASLCCVCISPCSGFTRGWCARRPRRRRCRERSPSQGKLTTRCPSGSSPSGVGPLGSRRATRCSSAGRARTASIPTSRRWLD